MVQNLHDPQLIINLLFMIPNPFRHGSSHKPSELVTPLTRKNWIKGTKDRVKRGRKAGAEQKRINRQIRKSQLCLTFHDSPTDPTMESYNRDICQLGGIILSDHIR